jgi:hypothetical protein
VTLPKKLRNVLVSASVGAAALAPVALVSQPAQADQPGIQILRNEAVAVTFDKAKCKVGLKHGRQQFKAISTSHGWKLDVRLNDFTGYGDTYDIQYGMGVNNFMVTSPEGVRYTNIYSPDFPMPPSGGAAAFPGGKKKVLALGFIAAFSAVGAADGSDGVTVGGRATCSYKKKR